MENHKKFEATADITCLSGSKRAGPEVKKERQKPSLSISLRFLT